MSTYQKELEIELILARCQSISRETESDWEEKTKEVGCWSRASYLYQQFFRRIFEARTRNFLLWFFSRVIEKTEATASGHSPPCWWSGETILCAWFEELNLHHLSGIKEKQVVGEIEIISSLHAFSEKDFPSIFFTLKIHQIRRIIIFPKSY